MKSGMILVSVTLFILTFSSQLCAEDISGLKNRANSGDAAAQYEYAEELGWNLGDIEEAAVWWKKSADQTYPYAIIAQAQNDLANIAANFPENTEIKEKEYFSKECARIQNAIKMLEAQTAPQAYYNLAEAYSGGICVKEDQSKAENLYLQAAEKGNGPAAMRLGERCIERKDLKGAIKWLKIAAKRNLVKAKLALARLYFDERGTGKNEARSKELIKEIESSNNPMGLTMLGVLYRRGKNGFPKDMERGNALLRQAADMGYKPALKLIKKAKQE